MKMKYRIIKHKTRVVQEMQKSIDFRIEKFHAVQKENSELKKRLKKSKRKNKKMKYLEYIRDEREKDKKKQLYNNDK